MPDYGATPAAFIVAHVRGLSLERISLVWPERVTAPERNALFADDVADFQLVGAKLTASAPKRKAIELRNSPAMKIE